MERNIYKIGKELFITNDEEIKVGDWFYVKTPNIYGGNVAAKCLGFGENCWSEHILTDVADEKGYHPSHCVKIILTTDQDLIKDGVQSIDDEFLEWFVKNSSCESVEIRYTVDFNSKAVIIIPKEEPKQVTLEEVAERLYPEEWDWKEREIFIEGTKWQQERSHSEAIEFAEWIRIKDLQTASKDNWIGLDMKYYTTEELFEQFKKK